MGTQRISIELEGVADIMFDRFYDHKSKPPPEKKLHLSQDKDQFVELPTDNIHSFLFRDMPPVGAVRVAEGKLAGQFLKLGQAVIHLDPRPIQFTDGKKQIKVLWLRPKAILRERLVGWRDQDGRRQGD